MNNLEWTRDESQLKSSCATTVTEKTEPSPAAENKDVEHLVPPILRQFCRRPQSIEMRVGYDAPTCQTTYTYTLTWEDALGSEEHYRQVVEAKLAKMKRKSAEPAAPPVSTVCDGPCGRMFPADRLNAIERCGHYLCEACDGIVKNADGTRGCSSLHCNWNGKNKKEVKRYYEKAVCRKQRKHARDLRSRGIPVVPVSSLSNVSVSSNSSQESVQEPKARKKSKPKQQQAVPTASWFKLTYPSKEEIIGVKLVIVEPSEAFGINHTTGRLETLSSTNMKKAVSYLLSRRHQDRNMTLNSGDLYYAELQPDYSRKLRSVDMKRIDEMCLYEFPLIAEYVIFVLDTGEFVKSGVSIYFD